MKLSVDDSSVPVRGADPALGSDTSDSDDNKQELNKKSKKGEVLCTPAVRSFAKELNIDINDVTGTGKHGRISKEDVLKYAVEKGIIEDKPELLNPGSIEPMVGPEEKLQELAESLYHDKILSLRYFYIIS